MLHIAFGHIKSAGCASDVKLVTEQTLALLESLITADHNLLIWRSSPEAQQPLFYVWSTKLGGGIANGYRTLGAALFNFKENNKDALAIPSPPFTHSSQAPEHRPEIKNSNSYA